MQKIRQLVRYLGICDGNMEEGSLRCDANVSVRPYGQEAFGVKTEIKNMNSFRNVERAIDYEIKRQIRLLKRGGEVVHQTLLWDANQQETRPMRTKEMAHDYRYFPDPDLPQVVVTEGTLEAIRAALPELPEARHRRFVEQLGLPAYDASILTDERAVADYFEATLQALGQGTPSEADMQAQAKAVSNFVMTEVLRVLNERSLDIDTFPVEPTRLAGLIQLRMADKVNSSGAQDLFNAMLDDARSPEAIAEAHNLLQVSDEGALLPVVEAVLEKHTSQVQLYLDGKQSLIGFFIGQVMRSFDGSPDPKLVRTLLQERLDALRS
jgi:aspartyl-tRNA(Asn)/glutamyl-tRNA(Gln) amidotransferase subunit B